MLREVFVSRESLSCGFVSHMARLVHGQLAMQWSDLGQSMLGRCGVRI